MEATSDERLKVWQFLRRHFVRIVIGAVLAVAIYGMLMVWMPYQREQRIAKAIESHGGRRVRILWAGLDSAIHSGPDALARPNLPGLSVGTNRSYGVAFGIGVTKNQ